MKSITQEALACRMRPPEQFTDAAQLLAEEQGWQRKPPPSFDPAQDGV